MPSNSIAFARNYTSVIDEVYQRASVSRVLNSGRLVPSYNLYRLCSNR